MRTTGEFFDRLGVFAGRFSLDAASRVAGDGLGSDPLELLTMVVERSLVVLDGEDSYRLLDSLRAFAVEQLDAESADGEAARTRMAGWLAEFCEVRDAHQRVIDDDSVLAELRGVMPNVRVALDDCFTTGDRTIGVRLVAALVWFWGSVGANEEATRWLGRALETRGLDDEQGARLLEGVAMHSFASGDIDAGRRAAEQAARLWAQAGTPGRGFAALIYRGLAERARGDLELAAETLDRAVDIAIRNYSNWAVAVASYWRAAVAADQSDDQLAERLLEEARWRAEWADDRRATGATLHQLGRIALRSGDPPGPRPRPPGVGHPRGRRMESRDRRRSRRDRPGAGRRRAARRSDQRTSPRPAAGRRLRLPARRRQGLGGAGRGDGRGW